MIFAWLNTIADKSWTVVQLVAIIRHLIASTRKAITARTLAEVELASARRELGEAVTRAAYQKACVREAAAESAALVRGVEGLRVLVRDRMGGSCAEGVITPALDALDVIDDSHGRRLLAEMAETEERLAVVTERAERSDRDYVKLWDNVGDALDAGEHEDVVVAAARVKAELTALLVADDADATIAVQRDRARAAEQKLSDGVTAILDGLDERAGEDDATDVTRAALTDLLDSVPAQGELLLQELDDARARTNDAEIALADTLARLAAAETRAAKLAKNCARAANYINDAADIIADLGGDVDFANDDAREFADDLRALAAPSNAPAAPTPVACANCDAPTSTTYPVGAVLASQCATCAVDTTITVETLAARAVKLALVDARPAVRTQVVSAVIVRGGKMLLAQRAPGKAFAGLWESSGGKAEPGESFDDALARELREELGVEAIVGELLAVVTTDPPATTRPLTLSFFMVDIGEQEPRLGEDVVDLRWCTREDVLSLEMTPGNAALREGLAGLCEPARLTVDAVRAAGAEVAVVEEETPWNWCPKCEQTVDDDMRTGEFRDGSEGTCLGCRTVYTAYSMTDGSWSLIPASNKRDCETCEGDGNDIDPANPCRACFGSGKAPAPEEPTHDEAQAVGSARRQDAREELLAAMTPARNQRCHRCSTPIDIVDDEHSVVAGVYACEACTARQAARPQGGGYPWAAEQDARREEMIARENAASNDRAQAVEAHRARAVAIDAALRACLSTGPKRWFTISLALTAAITPTPTTVEWDAAEKRIGSTWDARGKFCSLPDVALPAVLNTAAGAL